MVVRISKRQERFVDHETDQMFYDIKAVDAPEKLWEKLQRELEELEAAEKKREQAQRRS